MNPLIARVNGLVQVADEATHWFDASELITKRNGTRVDISALIGCVLPYPHCVVVWSNGTVTYAVSLIQRQDDEKDILCCAQRLEPARNHQRIFWFGTVEDGLKVWPADGHDLPPEYLIQGFSAQMALWYSSLSAGQVNYHPTRLGTPAQQAKRARHGKAPLFEWRTVTIQPKQVKVEPQGGTHASPRLHDRRGHWRSLVSGKQIWVRNCKVGDASKGVVFKDYKL